MSGLSEDFNKITDLDLATGISIDRKKLDPEKGGLFDLVQDNLEKDRETLKQSFEDHRISNVALFANRYIHEHALTPDGSGNGTPIMQGEVRAMMERAGQEELPFDQLTPHSHREQFILAGYALTIAHEERKAAEREQAALAFSRQFMDDLLTLDLEDARERLPPDKAPDRDTRGPDDGASLTDLFNRLR